MGKFFVGLEGDDDQAHQQQFQPGTQRFQLQCPSQRLQAPAKLNEKLARKHLVE